MINPVPHHNMLCKMTKLQHKCNDVFYKRQNSDISKLLHNLWAIISSMLIDKYFSTHNSVIEI